MEYHCLYCVGAQSINH